ncbi:MAG: 3-deoxy-manno-octulosonate cytidylyltransferase [Planctomycetota bacterium]
MAHPKIVAVIPARLASTRLARKPLLNETGKYLFQHVYESVARARGLAEVVVATDSDEIVAAAKSFGANVELTRADHTSGTDRVFEVISRRPDAEIILNIQGDEPEVQPADVDILIETLLNSDCDAGTVAAPCPPDRVHDNAAVKVVLDLKGRALYFSRSPIPYPRYPAAMPEGRLHLVHAGLYAFRRRTLEDFAKMTPTPLERTESLEQLRLLENGKTMAVGIIARPPVGVDTPGDYQRFVAAYRAGAIR